jgi:hypothetical protein
MRFNFFKYIKGLEALAMIQHLDASQTDILRSTDTVYPYSDTVYPYSDTVYPYSDKDLYI